MSRLLAALSLWSLLCGAAPLPVRFTPAQPLVGVPLLLTVNLPDATTELAGLPALAPFELLEPPIRSGSELRILLLPMRPGDHRVPPLPLSAGGSGQIVTAELPLRVEEGIAADAEAAPLKKLERKTGGPLLRWTPILVAAVATALLSRRLLRRKGELTPALPETLEGEQLLAELNRRLAAETAIEADHRRLLQERLARLRFSPVPPEEAVVRQLLEDFEAARGAGT